MRQRTSSSPNSILSPRSRAEALEDLATHHLDVLVVGGGVVGAGSALDAATRGLRTGLVEMNDWASGTSSRSSRLIHGGLRYLEMLDFGLVREALKERSLLLSHLAPHLVQPVPFLYPLSRPLIDRLYVGAGVGIYDLLAASGTRRGRLPPHRHLSLRQTRSEAPDLEPAEFVGAIQYHDAQVDDARYTVSLVRSAASYGAHCASRTKLTRLLRDQGRIVGAELEDRESGRSVQVQSRHVVLATGVWSDEAHAISGVAPAHAVRVSKGVHLLVARERLRSRSGLIFRTGSSVLFVIPTDAHWIIGTTDTPWSGRKEHPTVTEEEIAYLLGEANHVLADPLCRDDVVGVYAGLRPLLGKGAGPTTRLSREHAVTRPAPGLTAVAGGKYTTYRVMAKDTVDAVAAALGHTAPCVTDRTPLVGASGYEALWNARHRIEEAHGLAAPRIERLLRRYGSEVHDLLDLMAQDPGMALPVAGAESYLAAEVVYAATHEGALHLEDVLQRRTHIAIETADGGAAAAPQIASMLRRHLGWTTEQTAAELASIAQGSLPASVPAP